MVRNIFKNGKIIFLRRQTNILSAAFVIMVTVLVSGLLGLFRDRLLAGRFFGGGEWQLDVYFAAFRLPDMIFQLLVIGALSAAFIPVFSEYLEKNKNEAYQVASSIINIVLTFFILFGLLIFIFAPQLCRLIAPSFSPEKIALMSSLTRLMLFAQVFFCISNFLTGIIQSNQRFLVPALAPVAYNLGIIFGIIALTPTFGIYGPTLGVVIGALLHFLVQIPLALKLGFSYLPLSWEFSHPGVKEIVRLMLPRTLALAVSQIEATVPVFLASSLMAGSLTIFYFAQHLMNLPVGLFGATIGQAALPALSQNSAKKDWQEFKKTFLSSFFQILYLVLPASAILLILRIPTVRLVFGTKNFPWQATILTGKTLALFTIAIFSQSIIQVLVRGFYALRNTKTPLLIGAFGVAINVFLSVLLTLRLGFGVLGLAAATSIASFIHAVLLFVFLDRKVRGFERKSVFIPLFKMSLATLVTAVFLWIPMRVLDRYILDTTRTINLIILTILASSIGLGVYILCSLIFKIGELAVFVGLAKKIGQWRKILSESEEMIDSTRTPQS
ncbi:murein biosynthesis integral membrane protein MurJ [Candidatus Shapirobacteria bacterium CG10_big_fil_rev_8_21_14_0_10_40_9]|uniref:Probable lipid II flippase MurJ n=1 Tax=Candidatus Shapirobacteria bacterium CG10_big_fil_rev_8_21_14_0_10_40_9 TaxID=1974888 RepID=A0A2M8L381_9BACT|nr:MAG: murein biosynthesis integral membrane protein MurJ [Candidatus Shapirobacteria bacterium CG10_big_fil_rev_8_21_14_0_10_40_9]